MKTATDGSTGPRPAKPVGIVLAGGASSRMGRDKALLMARGEPLDESLPAAAARRLAAVCAEVAVADRGRGLLPGVPSLADGPGRGPAAGILGAAAAYPGRSLLVLACDLPEVPVDLLAELVRWEDYDAAVPRWAGGFEPLCALYGPAALAVLAARVERGRFALHELAAEAGLTVRVVGEDELARFGRPEEIFLNLNTPEDWRRYERSTG
ncbi:MAG TPA: NTP transferase domain-containing protein [Thermoanaerobaculia bacterium]|jgi:molybdopterin-guanine dinucleotide biosynthesis protein A